MHPFLKSEWNEFSKYVITNIFYQKGSKNLLKHSFGFKKIDHEYLSHIKPDIYKTFRISQDDSNEKIKTNK